mgnify:CR=1 FL=1
MISKLQFAKAMFLIRLGSIAASIQSMMGSIGAPSVFAYLQSAAMGGYGVAAVNGVAQACAFISGGAVSMYSSFTGRG